MSASRNIAIKNLSKAGKSSGRPKGSKNRFTSLKQSFLEAFEELGGTEGLTEWAKKNKGMFYQMLAKMLPKTVESDERPIVKLMIIKNKTQQDVK